MDSWVASEVSVITENLILDVTGYLVDSTMMQILNCSSAFFLDLRTNKCDTVSKSSWLCFQVPIQKIRNLVGKEGITFQNMVRAYNTDINNNYIIIKVQVFYPSHKQTQQQTPGSPMLTLTWHAGT